MTTLADLVFIDSTGYHYADLPTFLSWRQSQYQGIYGADVYLEPDSQDGQLLAAQAQSDYDTAALGASIYNSFSPVTAQGVGLSRVVKINGLTRRGDTNSTVDLVIIGTAGTLITNGVAQDSINQSWLLPASVTIPGGGTITVTATAAVSGAISAQANTITNIFTPTLGWQTVTNPSTATIGQPVEDDADLRVRQSLSTANPSVTVFDGTIGGVANVTGVTAVRGYENDDDISDANGLPPHSISIVVAGGDDTAVANEIALHKTPGTQTYGSTSVTVEDAHGMPLDIHFYRPIQATIGAQVTISINSAFTSDYITLIQQAIAMTINAFGIGNDILLTKLYAPAYLNGTPAGMSYTVSLIELNKDGGSFSGSNVTILFNEQPFCDPAVDVTVNVT